MHVRHPFLTFLCCRWTTTPEKCLISRFMENENKQQQTVISLSEIGYGPLKFNSRGGFCLHTVYAQSNWVRIIVKD